MDKRNRILDQSQHSPEIHVMTIINKKEEDFVFKNLPRCPQYLIFAKEPWFPSVLGNHLFLSLVHCCLLLHAVSFFFKHSNEAYSTDENLSTPFPVQASPVRRENTFPTSLDGFKQIALSLAELSAEIFVTKARAPAPPAHPHH